MVTKKTILVVDDEEDNRSTVKCLLKNNGFDVVLAVDGDDCLKKLKGKKKFDLILLDIMMPGTPVSEVVKQIKDTKIVFLSVVRTSEAQKENLLGQKNIVDFIQKPFDIDDLLKKVKKLAK